MTRKLTKVEKLAIAGAVAPTLRGEAPKRKIKVVDKDGKVVREIDATEMRKGVLRTQGIEFGIDPPKDAREQRVCAGPTETPWWESVTDPSAACPNRAAPTKAKLINAYQKKKWWRCPECRESVCKNTLQELPEERCPGALAPCPSHAVANHSTRSGRNAARFRLKRGHTWRCMECTGKWRSTRPEWLAKVRAASAPRRGVKMKIRCGIGRRRAAKKLAER